MSENGERKLILAIIENAILDSKTDLFKIKDPDVRAREREQKHRADEWLRSDSESEKSFNWYCRLLDMDPEWARKKIKSKNLIVTHRGGEIYG